MLENFTLYDNSCEILFIQNTIIVMFHGLNYSMECTCMKINACTCNISYFKSCRIMWNRLLFFLSIKVEIIIKHKIGPGPGHPLPGKQQYS